ncbi:hypothetical protein LTR85_007511 [Meristemomyces frigidus]|nr:hypothetical protein LTR85_007511 [Meristemomyces frigidus]
MAEDDGFDIDPAIAEAMGFSGFGMQPGKKRKFDTDDGFVDPDAKQEAKPGKSQSKSKGASHTPLGLRPAQGSIAQDDSASLTAGGGALGTGVGPEQARTAQSIQQQSPRLGPTTGGDSRHTDMQALRHGVANERGDMVYFLPSFIEDPWKHLRPQ